MCSPFCALLAKVSRVPQGGEAGKMPLKPAADGTAPALSSVGNVREQESGRGNWASRSVTKRRHKRATSDRRIPLLRSVK